MHKRRVLIKKPSTVQRLRKCRMSFWAFQAISMEMLFLLNLISFITSWHCCADLAWVVQSPLPLHRHANCHEPIILAHESFQMIWLKVLPHPCIQKEHAVMRRAWPKCPLRLCPSLWWDRPFSSAEVPSLGLKQLLFCMAVLFPQSNSTRLDTTAWSLVKVLYT